MKHFAILLCSCLQLVAGSTNLTTYESFNPASGKFDLIQAIVYELPDPIKFGPGPYPVSMWTPGSFEDHNDNLGQLIISEMALRGFIGAAVQYNNTQLVQNCTSYTQRAQGVFQSTVPTSAVGVLCALPQASCDKGLVTAGISQGAALAVLAKNYAPAVNATFALSVSDYIKTGRGTNLAACLAKSTTAIPADRLTIVNGEADTVFGGQAPLMATSGFTCPTGTLQCWSPDGSGAGWYIVQNSQVEDGEAGHCYMIVDGCFGPRFDPGWEPPAAYNWSLAPNLNWLATLGTSRVFSSSGQ